MLPIVSSHVEVIVIGVSSYIDQLRISYVAATNVITNMMIWWSLLVEYNRNILNVTICIEGLVV